jgi:hypothetical protein
MAANAAVISLMLYNPIRGGIAPIFIIGREFIGGDETS